MTSVWWTRVDRPIQSTMARNMDNIEMIVVDSWHSRCIAAYKLEVLGSFRCKAKEHTN